MDFMSYLEDTNEGGEIKKSCPLPDFHLRNPIHPLLWLDNADRRSSRHKYDLAQLNNKYGFTNLSIGSPTDFILNKDLAWPEYTGYEEIEQTEKILYTRLSIDKTIFPSLKDLDVTDLSSVLNRIDDNLWRATRFWNRVLLILNALSSGRELPSGAVMNQGGVTVSLIPGTLFVLKTCIAFEQQRGDKVSLYDGDWVRMTSDIFTQRLLVRIAIEIGQSTNPYQYPPWAITKSIIEWGDGVLTRYKNDGYKLLKTYEALVIGVLQSKGTNSVVDPSAFLMNTLKDLSDSDPLFRIDANHLVNIVMKIDNPHWITQLYGLHRIWGHPMVFSAEGMVKTAKIGKKDIIKDLTLSVQAGRMFKYIFSREYKSKHGKYPPIADNSTALCTALISGDSNAVSLNIYPLEDWDRVRFLQVYQLPETFNLSMIVADKSISPTKSELVHIVKRKKSVMDPDKRRGVKRWLDEETINPQAFLKSVEEGSFPDDHKIIGLTPKERELNPIPRMFALMSHLLRVYVVLTEQMISDHILKMFPQITMTDTLLDLTKKMYSTVKSQSTLNKKRGRDKTWASRVICMSLDFEKWNGHMRKEMTSGVFTPMGDLFGLTEIFNVTYDIFSECYYYLADGSYVPKIKNDKLVIEEPFSFSGHKGGMEGLRQKGWTVFTVCGLEVVLSSHNCTYKIMGMGDNQVLQVTLYTNQVTESGDPTEEGIEEMQNELNSIFRDLVVMFTSAGLPLKPLETWMSEDLYLYGKVPIWRGVPLSLDVKKLMRMFPFSNAEVMTWENALGTISGNALSATQSTSSILTAYIMNIIMSCLCIIDFMRYHPLLGKGLEKAAESVNHWTLITSSNNKHKFEMKQERHLNKDQIVLLITIIPRTLMGYNGLNLLELMMRGFPDNLSRDVTYIWSVYHSNACPEWLKVTIYNWVSPIYMPTINYSTLVQDVTAINVIGPRSPSSGIKQVVTKYMTEGVNIRNSEFNDLMRSKDKLHEEFLAELLCHGEELHIRLIHDIMEASIYGYVESILSKVVKTTTIQRLAMRSSAQDIFDVICSDELTYFAFFKWRSVNQGKYIKMNCPTSICKQLRLEGWQKQLRGITIPHPHAYIIRSDCDKQGECQCIDGYMSVSLPDHQMKNDDWFLNLGSNAPYLGSMTKEKVVVGAGGKVYSSEPLIKRPLNLLRIINWFVPEESNTADIIKLLVSSVTDMDPTPYVGMTEGTAGAEVHRYKDSGTTHGALTSSSYLFSTRYHISSDHFHRYCRNSENTDLHFQALYCYIVENMNMELIIDVCNDKPMPRFVHYKQQCYECISPVKEDYVDIPGERILSAIPSRKSNPYLFVDHSKIRILEDRSPLSHLSETSVESEWYENCSPADKLSWLHDVISDKITSDIVGDKEQELNEAEFDMNNVGAYERTMYMKLDPRCIIERVMGNLQVIAEWKWLEFTGHQKKLSVSEKVRLTSTIIKSAHVSSFVGLSMFYCWENSAKRLMSSYAEMVAPMTNPVSIESGSIAVRESLISLCYRQEWSYSARSSAITDDEKSQMTTMKLYLYEWLKNNSDCLSCKRLILNINSATLRWTKRMVCVEGHRPYDKMSHFPWRYSFVTIERLRKDCASALDRLPPGENDTLPTLKTNFIISLLKSSHILGRPEAENYVDSRWGPHFPSTWYMINRRALIVKETLPTRTRSKYIPLLVRHKDLLKGKHVFVLGDGLGTTSRLIQSAGANNIICSTILDPGKAIPHAYIHNISPSHMTMSGYSNIDSKSALERINDVLDPRWVSSWQTKVSECSILISDMEMIGTDRGRDVAESLRNVLTLKCWDLVLFKVYIYSCDDLCNIMRSVLVSNPKKWEIITTPFRSFHYPEMWIEMRYTSKVDSTGGLTQTPSKMMTHWRRMLEKLTDVMDDIPLVNHEIEDILAMSDKKHMVRMTSTLRSWLTVPTVGLMLPNTNRSMTSIFYYLQKIKRPRYVKDFTHDKNLKLYSSDYYKLRDILLCLALSMCGDDRIVISELSMSRNWYLYWSKRNDNWYCVLSKSLNPEGKRAEIDDYLPLLRSHMKSIGLQFWVLGSEVWFKPGNIRKINKSTNVYFHISNKADKGIKYLYEDSQSV
ncbi:MAG: RNA-dependent RNA polymerase [Pastinaca cytorhabdovirus 1]|uniref:Replicase n=1 Tax=Pastinaca cytorhabdovirus 1 TaxID=2950847 RepID=A0AAE9MT40_9RHAB|nr:MAG: RNA-dependent RNA polymerase [Pastinaca cytorhabdovirus 1]